MSCFFSADQVNFSSWKILFNSLPYHINQGNGSGKVWLKFQSGHLIQAQSALKLNQLHWNQRGSDRLHQLEHFSANMAWHPTASGWQWTGDHVFIVTKDKTWPENSFALDYQLEAQQYRLFIQELNIDQTLLSLIDWPDNASVLLKLNPKGHLKDTQIGWNQGQLNYFLSRFENVSWQTVDNIPQVKNLSGALYWEPTEGRLELDSANTELFLPSKKPLKFQTINTALDWKQLNDTWKLSLDRLIIEHPHLILSSRGSLDHHSAQNPGDIQLSTEFSAKEAEFWLPYIPEFDNKPRLTQWLKQDISRIGAVNGRLLLSGNLNDFPFDTSIGEFSVTAALEDTTLYFRRDWPKVRNVDAYLTVNKRTLNTDILNGDLYPHLPIEKLNIQVSELGLGHETLLVHGIVNAPANRMLSYVFVSPLQNRLQKLKVLSVEDNLDLDVALAIPLYPENDNILVRGSVLFNDNNAQVNLDLSPLPLQHIMGTLFFDENGVSESQLQATFLDELIRLQVQSVPGKKATTQIQFTGDFAIGLLKKQWNSPIFEFIRGRLPLSGVISLVEVPNAWDTLIINSTMQGVEVNLPAPLNKSLDEFAPLSVKADFNFDKGIHLKTHWAENRLHSDFWFSGKNKNFQSTRGYICIGCESYSLPNSGTVLAGEFKTIDWTAWNNTFNTLNKLKPKTSNLNWLNQLKLNVESVEVLGQNYHQLQLSAQRNSGAWSILVKQQQKAIADLHYQTSTNTLTGHINQFVFVTTDEKHKAPDRTTSINPNQIPQLSLTIDQLFWNKMSLGKLFVKGGSHENVWQLEEGQLTAPSYTLKLTGAWFKQDMTNKTNVDAVLEVNNLTELLQLWDVPPVVEAERGTLQLKGGWLGDFRAFSLSRLSGTVNIEFKNGRITHLDPATEEKLGLGKLLSILSLQTIPRRLKLDFSDLANDGYSFDQFEGQFVMKDGVMSTDESTINGPVALAKMKGQLDLDKRLYDLDLHVTPHITASLPVVATIAGGPIAGIATWAASKILNSGVDKVSGYTYTITGPWLEPVVQQVHIFRKKDKK